MGDYTIFLGDFPPQQGALFVLAEDSTPEIRLRLPRGIAFEATTPFSFDDIQYFSYQPEGPVLRFICRIYQDPEHLEQPIRAMEIFLDPAPSGKHQRLLESLTTCAEIRVRAWEDSSPPRELGQKMFAWRDELQEAIKIALREARRAISRTHWPAAADRCMRENNLTL
jgi:hypothetical protein